MIFLISDTHFNHKNIIKYEDRPFSCVREMNDELIKRWNAVVAPDDIVYHLGDVALGPTADLDYLVPALNGHKILVRGNHDACSRNRYLAAGFEDVFPRLVIEACGHKILLTHCPNQYPDIPHDLHFYGHVHSKGNHGSFPTIARNGACLCVERWDYRPVELEHLIELCANAPFDCPNI